MEELFRGKIREFIAGSTVGFIAGLKFLFAGPMDWGTLAVQYTLKFVAVIIFSFVSGVATMAAKDLYEAKIKTLFKKKNNGRNLEEDNKK